MKWLLINAYFPPEIGSAAFLFHEFGRKLAARGCDVTVVTGFPRYNCDAGALPPRYKRGLRLEEEVDGMRVLRLRTPALPRYIPVARGIEQFCTALIFLWGGLRATRDRRHPFDRIIVYSPPLPLGLTAYGISRIRKIPFIFNVQDLFPQSAVDLGILKNRFLVRAFEALERFIYRAAFLVTAHSEGNRRHVLEKGGGRCRARVVPNWVDTEAVLPGERDNSFRREFMLGGKFVVSFAGVIGYSQDLDTVIDCAPYLKAYNDILFLMVGDGVEKERLEERARSLGIGNLRFIPMQPKEKYPLVLHASDVCLVTLRREVKTPVVPSKLLHIMAATRPVVASLNLDGDAPRIIAEARCGICIEPGEPRRLAAAILKLYHDRRLAEELGRNGRRYAELNFSLDQCVKMYESV